MGRRKRREEENRTAEGPVAAVAPLPALSPGRLRLAVALPFAVATLGFVGKRFRADSDPDLWWHLRVGRDTLAHGIRFGDVYSYTRPGYRWVDHEWGLNVLMDLAVRAAGGRLLLLAVLFAAAALGAFRLAGGRLLARPRTASGEAAAGLVVLGAIAVAWSGLGLAAQTASLLGMALLVGILLDEGWSGRPRSAWLVPLGFLLWANLHAGFAAGLLLLAVDAGWDLVSGRGFPKRKSVIGLAAFAATFLNPYGWRVYEEVLRVSFDAYAKATISEWKAPTFESEPAFRVAQGVILLLVVVGFLRGKESRPPARALVLAAPFFLLAMGSARHLPLFAVTNLPLAGFLVERNLVQPLAALLPAPGKRWPLVAGALAAGAAALFAAVPLVDGVRSVATLEGMYATWPTGAIDYLKAHGLTKGVVVEYGWGGFLEWYAPEIPVFADGRMASWDAPLPWEKPDPERPRILAEFHSLANDPVGRARTIAKYRLEYLLGQRSAFDAVSSVAGNPTVLYADDVAVLTRLAPPGS